MRDSHSIIKYLTLGAAIALANFLVYRQTTSFAPVHLDEQQLLSDKWRNLKAGRSFPDAFKHDVFNLGTGAFYRPVLTLSFIADARLSGDKFDPAPFHRSNLFLHIFNALLCFILLARLAYGAELAAAGAMLFSLHPALAAASGWIPGRNDSLLFAFSALALLFLTEAAKRRNAGLFILHLIAFFLALLTKETAAVLLPLFPAWIYVFHRDSALSGKWKLKAAAALGWIFCAGLYLFLRTGALKGGPANLLSNTHDLVFRTASYAAFVFVPVNIPVFAWFSDLSPMRIILADTAGLILLAAAWQSRKGKLLPCAFAAFCLFILPSAFSDRFLPHRLYLPVFFFALAATEAARIFYPAKRALTLAVMAASALCLAAITFHSLRRFKDPDVFWADAYAVSPSCGEAAYELGYSAQLRGDMAGAEKYYLKVITGSPSIPDARTNLGVIYKQAGRYDEALRLYEDELKLTPGKAIVIENIGNLMAARGDYPRAIEYYKLKIAIEPEVRKTYEILVFCFQKTGDLKEADKYRRIALTLKNP
ncbi:MAG: tetratricopeptide repeat protein [Elusimicrobia bacterium]|nr:tetratricopeptide repeat protein [Elusimicrobiota bacterium]